jgi:hypothetical protein
LLGLVRWAPHFPGSSQQASAARAASPSRHWESSPAEFRDQIETRMRAFKVVRHREPRRLIRTEIVPGRGPQSVRKPRGRLVPEIGRLIRLACVCGWLHDFRNGGVRILQFRGGRALNCVEVALRFDGVGFVRCVPIILRFRRPQANFFRRPFARRTSSAPPPVPLVPRLLLASAASPRLGADVICSGQFSKLCGKNFGWGNKLAQQMVQKKLGFVQQHNVFTRLDDPV